MRRRRWKLLNRLQHNLVWLGLSNSRPFLEIDSFFRKKKSKRVSFREKTGKMSLLLQKLGDVNLV